MTEELEGRFAEIAERAIAEAEGVRCSLIDFALGLTLIARTIKQRADDAKEEAGV